VRWGLPADASARWRWVGVLAGGVLGLALLGAGLGVLWYRADGGSRGPVPAGAPAGTAGSGASSWWQIAYDRTLDGKTELFVIPAGGGVERRLAGQASLGRWTPDGRRIVFTSGRSGTPQLWEIDAEGGRPRRLRDNTATEYQADVSPDGRQLAFLSNLDGPERLMIEDLRSGALRELVRHGDHAVLGNPHWSPDGRWLAFSSNWRIGHHIYLVEVATGQERRISPLTSGGCEARFSRDGRELVYVSRGHLRPTSRLVEHDLASDEEKVLVNWPALNYDPVYSPDGSELAFASNIAGAFAIYRQRLSDGKAWRVTFGPGDARNPDYRPVPSGQGAHDSR
jgi:Tol biopolymer transport system component